jgi:RNA-binding protein YlmH
VTDFRPSPHQKYINEEVAKVLVLHADHYKDFADADHLKRLVGLMHRIGVKRQAEGVFFKVSCGPLLQAYI